MSEPTPAVAVGDPVRRSSDGQLGEVIADADGVLMVKLDRGPGPGGAGFIEPYLPRRWAACERRLPLHGGAVAKLVYEAVSSLRRLRGDFGQKTWDALNDGEQKKFATTPPTDPEQRRLWTAMIDALQQRSR